MPTENHQKPQERRAPDQQGIAWTNLILNMIIGSSVTADYVTETIYRVFFGSKSIHYLLQILEYLLLSRVIIRIVFHVIKILSVLILSSMSKIMGNCFFHSMEEHTVQPKCLLKLVYVLWILQTHFSYFKFVFAM